MTVAASDSANERTTSASESIASRASAHRVQDVETERGRDLVVSRAAGMDLAADLAEEALDRRMHVLVGVEIHLRGLSDLRQPTLEFVELRGAQQAGVGQAASVLGRGLAVVGEELRVVGAEELPHLGVELLPDPPLPGRHAVIFARFRAACSSVSSEEIAMNPSAASWGNVSPVAYEASSTA